MCEACFYNEINRFDSFYEYEKFDLELSKKIKPLSKIGLKYIGESEFAFDMACGKYLCQDCNTEWLYSEPENAWRGFFMKEQNAQEHLKSILKSDKKKQYGCLLFVLIVAVAITLLFCK